MARFTVRRFVGALALIAALCATTAGPASAATKQTDIRVKNNEYIAPELRVSGDLVTPRGCKPGRKLKLVVIDAQGDSRVADTDVTRRSGSWKLEAIVGEVGSRAEVRVSKKRLSRKTTCGADREQVLAS